MAEYPIPPWIAHVADPVQAYSHGLQIGASIGEAQSRQQLAQEQMLRQQQKDMVQSEIEKQTFQLKADEAAKQYSAQQKFAGLVQSGMDPLQAILQTPEIASHMGPAVAAVKAGQISPFQQAEIDHWKRMEDAKAQGKEYGDIKTVDLGDGVRAVFRPGSPGLHIIQPKGEKTLSPTAAATLLKSIPEIDAMAGTTGTTNALAQTLAPDLLDIIRKTTGKKADKASKKIGRFTITPVTTTADSTDDTGTPADQGD